MHCSTCSKLLGLYAGGDLSPDETREVDVHLADCAACRAELEALRDGVAALRSARVDEQMLVDDAAAYWHDLEGIFRARALDVEHLQLSHPWWRVAPRLVAQAAVVLIAAAAALWFALMQQTPPEAPEQPPVVQYTPDAPGPANGFIVVLPPDGARGQTDVTTVAADDNEVYFSDFGIIRRAGDLRRLRQSVVPATYEDDGPF